MTRGADPPFAQGVEAWRRLISCVALTAVAGCSFALSGPDPNRPASRVPECDTGKGLVGLDGLIGGTLAVSGLALLGNDEAAGAAITGLLGVAFIASAVRGNTAVNECRGAIAEFHTRPYDPGPEEPRLADERPVRAPRPKAPVQPPTVMQPPEDPYADAPPEPATRPTVRPTPPTVRPTPPTVAPTPTTPTTPTRPAGAGKPAPATPPARPAPEPDDWSEFWTEAR